MKRVDSIISEKSRISKLRWTLFLWLSFGVASEGWSTTSATTVASVRDPVSVVFSSLSPLAESSGDFTFQCNDLNFRHKDRLQKFPLGRPLFQFVRTSRALTFVPILVDGRKGEGSRASVSPMYDDRDGKAAIGLSWSADLGTINGRSARWEIDMPKRVTTDHLRNRYFLANAVYTNHGPNSYELACFELINR